MFVKPRDGYKIRDHYKKDLIPETGREVPDNDMYWVSRLNDGDVVLAEPPTTLPVVDAAETTQSEAE